MNWSGWNLGGKSIFVAFCAAVASMLLNWVDIGIATRNGFSQGTFLFLLLWIYPVRALFRALPISRLWGLLSAGVSALFTLIYIGSKTGEIFGKKINVASTGAWVFLLASIGLGIAILLYHPTAPSPSSSDA